MIPAHKSHWYIVMIVVFLISMGVVSCIFGFYKILKLGIFLQKTDTNSQQKQSLIKEFSGKLMPDRISGFYARSNDKKVWLWTLNGIESFIIKDEPTESIYFGTCGSEISEIIGSKLLAKQTVTQDIKSWLRNIKSGYYTKIIFTDDNNQRKIESIISFSGDIFMRGSIKQQCSKF